LARAIIPKFVKLGNPGVVPPNLSDSVQQMDGIDVAVKTFLPSHQTIVYQNASEIQLSDNLFY